MMINENNAIPKENKKPRDKCNKVYVFLNNPAKKVPLTNHYSPLTTFLPR